MKSLTFIIMIIILIAYMNDEHTERINHNDHLKNVDRNTVLEYSIQYQRKYSWHTESRHDTKTMKIDSEELGKKLYTGGK